MKRHISLLAISVTMLISSVFSQKTSTLEVFSENGEKFSLVINGVSQNDAPATNVKAEGLKGDFHRVSVTFEDASLGMVNQNFALDPGMYQRASVVLRRNGKYAIRPFGEPVALAEAPAPAPAPAPAERPDRQAEMPRGGAVTEVTVPDAEITTTTTTTTTKTGSGESVRMDIGIGGQRVGVNVEVNDPTQESVHSTTVIETTETRVTKAARTSEAAPANPPAEEKVDVCAPMASGSFAGAKRSVESKSFADEKKTTARQILRSNCMSTDQIIEMMGAFSFEDDKLEFAKMAYDRCSDPENYWKLNDAFTFGATIEELDEFIQSK